MRFYSNNHGRGVSFGWIGLFVYGLGWLLVWTMVIAVGLVVAILFGIWFAALGLIQLFKR